MSLRKYITFSFFRRDFRHAFWKYLAHRLFKTMRIKTSQGTYDVFTRDKIIGSYLFNRGEVWQNDFKEYIYEFLDDKFPQVASKQHTTLYNIGANIGTSCIPILLDEKVFNVVAIEADPSNYELLKKNASLNKLADRMHCIHCAVSDTKGNLRLHLNGINLGDHRIASKTTVHENEFDANRTVTVPSDTLTSILKNLPDNIVQKKNALLWVDVQGYEGFLFAGAEKWINKFSADNIICVCEVTPYMIKDSGMGVDRFIELCSSIWNYYYVYSAEKKAFVKYPIPHLTGFVEFMMLVNIDSDIIFTKV